MKPVVAAGTWDLGKVGLVFGLAMGPYGTLLALCWDRIGMMGGHSTIVLLHSDPSTSKASLDPAVSV